MKKEVVTIERVTIELSVNQLADRWMWLLWECGIEELLITERIHNGVERVYIVNGLTMELEQEYAMCTDWEEKIFDMDSMLKMFLQQSLVSIKLLPIENGYREELIFSNKETIYIEKAS